MNNIQRVIDDSNKKFDEKFTSVWSSKHGELIRIPDGIKENIKSHISETIRQVLQAVEEEVGNKGKKQNTNLCAKCNTILPSNWLPPICPDCFYCDDKDKWNGVRDKETKDAFTRGHDFAMSQVKSLLKCTKENIK